MCDCICIKSGIVRGPGIGISQDSRLLLRVCSAPADPSAWKCGAGAAGSESEWGRKPIHRTCAGSPLKMGNENKWSAISARLESFNWSCMVVVLAILMAIILLLLVVLVVVALVQASLSWYSAQNQRQDNARVNPTAEYARPEGGIACRCRWQGITGRKFTIQVTICLS